MIPADRTLDALARNRTVRARLLPHLGADPELRDALVIHLREVRRPPASTRAPLGPPPDDSSRVA